MSTLMNYIRNVDILIYCQFWSISLVRCESQLNSSFNTYWNSRGRLAQSDNSHFVKFSLSNWHLIQQEVIIFSWVTNNACATSALQEISLFQGHLSETSSSDQFSWAKRYIINKLVFWHHLTLAATLHTTLHHTTSKLVTYKSPPI